MARGLKILHMITGLGPGGAQSSLIELIRHSPLLDHTVVSLNDDEHPYREKLERLHAPVHTLHMSDPTSLVVGGQRLWSIVRSVQPDWIHCWLYHADLLGGLVGRALRRRVLWHLHVSAIEAHRLKASTRWVRRRCAELSPYIPEHIVACSHSTAESHRSLGYASSVMRVIENGVDVDRFRHRDSIGARQTLGIDSKRFTVGIAARFHPLKDIKTCLVAFDKLRRSIDAQLLLVGDGMTSENVELNGWIRNLGLGESVTLLGAQERMEEIYPAFDVFSLSSISEALSMSLLEAMACEVVPVVTNVGDSHRAVGAAGWTVPTQDPSALAERWKDLHAMHPDERSNLGFRAREHVVGHYSAQRQAERFGTLYATGVRRP